MKRSFFQRKTQAFSLTKTQDSERLLLDLCRSPVNLPEEPDAENPQVRFCEGPGPTDDWLKYCGTAGKPGGKQRKQTSTCISGETGLLDSI